MQCLIVDDHPLTRDGTSLALRAIDASLDIREASSLKQACGEIVQCPDLDLVLLDLELDDSFGVATLVSVKRCCEENGVDARIVVMSGRASPELV